MQKDRCQGVFTIPRFEQIPYLIHGFGSREWTENEFKMRPEWKGFQLLYLNQIHSNLIHFIDKPIQEKLKGDAIVTNLPLLLIIIKTADCLPVLIVDEKQQVIAAVHCGWRGTSKGVIRKVIQGMRERYGCLTSSLLVAMGPCIKRECYEVGDKVVRSFEKQGLSTKFFSRHPHNPDKFLFDLREANLAQMEELGVERGNIFMIDVCTHCCPDLDSYRRDKDKAGRLLSFVGMCI